MILSSKKRRAAASIALLLSTATIALSSDAVAQPVTNQRRSAETVFKSGLESFRKGDYETARSEFEYVYAKEPKPEVLWNLALAEEKSNHLVEALAHFRAYFTDATVPQLKRDRAKKHIEDVYALLGHLAIRATAGSTISIDTKPLDSIPTTAIDVTAGKHVVSARIGERVRSVEVTAIAGFATEVDVRLDDVAPPPAPSSSAPLPPPPTAQDLVLPPPKPTPPEQGFWTTRRYVGLAVAGAGVVMVGVGALFGAKSNDAADRANALQASVGATGCSTSSQQCADLADAHDSANRNHTLSTVFVVTGIAAAATGLAVVLWPRSNPSQTTVAPMVSPSTAGLQLHGAF